MSNTKRNKHLGGGEECKTSLFKPIVATSLALALGVNVASANISITDGSNDITFNNGFSTQTSDSGASKGYDVFMNGSNPIETLMVWIGNGSDNFKTSSNPVELQTDSSTTITSNNGISMNGGSGTLKLSSWTDANRTITLDLQSVTSDNYAVLGHLSLEGKDPGNPGNIVVNLGGKGVSGSVTIKNGTNSLSLSDSAKIEGDFAIQKGANTLTFGGSSSVTGATAISGGTNIINPTDHAVFDGALTISGGTTTLLTDLGNKNANELLNISSNAIALSGGALALGFTDSVANDNKIFQLNTQNFNKITFSGAGALAFDGAKTVYFNNGTADSTGDGTLNGNVKFIVDPSITTANNPSQAILKGSIEGGASFSLKSSEDIDGINPFINPNANSSTLGTYYVDGNITITNSGGGFSAFWDDSKGFIGKIATTGANHSISFSGGLSGKNDAWFDSGTFTNGSNTISSIQATSGTSHLVFEDAINIGNGNTDDTPAIEASGGSGMMLFKNTTTINKDIQSLSGGNLLLLFNGNSVINSSQINLDTVSKGTKNMKNQIIFNGSSAVIGSDSTKTNIGLTLSMPGGSWNHIGNNVILSNATSNTFKFGSISINGNYGSKQRFKNTFSVISLNSGTNDVSIDSILPSYGNVVLGKDIVTGSNSVTYNSAMFGADSTPALQTDFISEFVKTTHSANGTYVFGVTSSSNAISTGASGANYLNLSGTTTFKGNILSSLKSAGSNATGHNNLVVLTGTSATLGEDSNKISIKVDNAMDLPRDVTSNNTILLGASANSINLSELSASGTYGANVNKNFNALSFNNASDTGSRNIGSISASYGNNIVGKNLITQEDTDGNGSGYNTALFVSAVDATMKNDFATTFMSDTYTAKGSITIGSGTGNAITATNGNNFINMENITISGNITSSGGGNYIYAGATTGGTSSITGNISASSGSNNITFKSSGTSNIGSISTSGGVNNIIANGTFVIGSNTGDTIPNAISTDRGGQNNINLDGTTTIKGNISSSSNSANGSGHNNFVVLTGTSATLGESSKAISISVANSTVGGLKYSNNTLLLGATTNTLTLSSLSVSGDFGGNAPSFNALSFNGASGSSGSINSVSAGFGFNIVGKNLVTQGEASGYNTTLFSTSGNNPSLASNFLANFVKSDYAVQGDLTIGDNTSSPIPNAITVSQSGANYLNLSGTTTIKGNILSSFKTATSNVTGHNNFIILTGTSVTLGESSKAISISVDNTQTSGDPRNVTSNNTILLGANTNSINLSELSASGTYAANINKNFNALSFNNANNTGSRNVGAISASYGSNLIGKNLITQGDSSGNGSGYNTALFVSAGDGTMKNDFATTFMSDTYTAKGSITIGSGTGNAITATNGNNFINMENITISGNITSSGGGNYIYAGATTGGTSSITGNISASSGSNNITFKSSGTSNIGSISTSGNGTNTIVANSGIFVIGDNSATPIADAITSNSGRNNITLSGTTTIKGNISSQSNGGILLNLAGASATFGASGKEIAIKLNNGASGGRKQSNNTVIVGTTTSELYLSEIFIIGEYSTSIANITQKNFNAISLNSSTNTANIGSISASFGVNIVGKDLVSNDKTYSSLFDSSSELNNSITAEFVKSDYSANGNFVIGTDNTKNAIVVGNRANAYHLGPEGRNYISLNGTTTIKGNILTSFKTAGGAKTGHNNLVVLTGNSATLGEDSNKISISVDNVQSDSSKTYDINSNNTILLGANTNSINLSALSANGMFTSNKNKNFNALSFNNANDTGTKNIGTISVSSGSNLIGKNLITQGDSSGNGSGYNTALFVSAGDGTMKDNFATTFMSDTYTAKGTLNVGTTARAVATNVITSSGGGNYINIETIVIAGNVTASNGGNYIYANQGENSISGSVSSTNGGNSATGSNTIILKGTSSSISAGVSSVGGGNTITLSATTNTISGGISASGGSNIVTFDNASATTNTIDGNISSNVSGGANASQTIVSKGILTFDTNTQTIQASSTGWGGTQNRFDISGATTFKNDIAIISSQNNVSQSSAQLKNFFKFGDNVSFSADKKITELSSAMSSEMASTSGSSRILNALSLDGDNQSTLTIGAINKKDTTITSNGGRTGNNYIGKGFVTGTGNSLALNFDSNTWNSSSNQANVALSVENDIFTNNGANYINVKSITANTITAEGGSNNIAFGANSEVLGNITKSSNGENNFIFTADNTSLTLKGTNSAITTLTAVSGNATNGDTLILDTTDNANTTSIDNLISGGNLIVNMKGSTNSATLTLNNTLTDSTIKTLNLTETSSSADKNILNLQARKTTILDEVNITSGKGLTINFNGTATLDNAINTDGSGATTIINIANSQAGVITGNITQNNNGVNNVVFNGGTAKLTLQGSSNTLNSVTANTSGILSLDGAGSESGVQANIATLTGDQLTANFNGVQGKKAELILNGSGTLAGVTLENNSINNILDLTQVNSLAIASAINLQNDQQNNQELMVKLTNTELTLASGNSKITALNVVSVNTADSTLKGGNVDLATLNLNATNYASLTLQNLSTTIGTLTSTSGVGQYNALILDTNSNAVSATINNVNASNLEIQLKGTTNTATLNIGGGTNSFGTLALASDSQNNTLTNNGNLTITELSSDGISALSINGNGTTTINTAIDDISLPSSGTLNLTLSSGTLVAKGGMNDSGNSTINLTLDSSSTLVLDQASAVSKLEATKGAKIDISKMSYSARTRATTNEFVIGSYKGDADFYVDSTGDKIDAVVFSSVQKKADSTKSSATIYVKGSYNTILNPNNLLVAQVTDNGYVSDENNSNYGSTDNMEIIGGKQLIGGTQVEVGLRQEVIDNTDAGNHTINYYLDKGVDDGAPIQYQEVASSALTVNYDLFLANFNSLNKRMGELRDDANSNGVWARVFGGAMSNDFGAGSKTEYVTAQAGYDYSLSVGNNARNFMGIAVAYGTSNTQGNTLSMNGLVNAGDSISLDKVDSHMVEVGIYNTFISDSGWYNDTIFKFDYIMSKFSLSNKTDLFTDTSNFAMVLSDEFGYRYSFGENEKGSWYVDPQVELAFGYFNQSDFNRAMYDASGYSTIMRAQQDTILTLRTRAGASLGKKFNTDKGFASVYVGAFYEYDYINGGNASVQGSIGGTTTSLDSLESNGRVMLNVGSNIELTKGARLYIDVEKSFGDKQRTFMQFNLGARYSF